MTILTPACNTALPSSRLCRLREWGQDHRHIDFIGLTRLPGAYESDPRPRSSPAVLTRPRDDYAVPGHNQDATHSNSAYEPSMIDVLKNRWEANPLGPRLEYQDTTYHTMLSEFGFHSNGWRGSFPSRYGASAQAGQSELSAR